MVGSVSPVVPHIINMFGDSVVSARRAGVVLGAAAAAGLGYAALRAAAPRPPPARFPDELPHSGTVVIFGLGFTGLRVADVLSRRGWSVVGTVRDAAAARRLSTSHRGVRALVFDSAADDSVNEINEIVAAVASATHILVTAAPTAAGDPVLAHSVRTYSLASCNHHSHACHQAARDALATADIPFGAMMTHPYPHVTLL